jgi:hypothetical protein
MGARIATVRSNTIIANPSAATETIVCQVGPINQINDNADVLLFWYFGITIGASGTAYALRLYRNNIISTPQIVAGTTQTAAAASNSHNSGCYFDTPGAGADLFYTLTAQVTSASGNSTTTDVCLMAMVL